jgi:hypothetical protein
MALNTSNAQLVAVQQLANTDGTVSTLAVARQLRRKYGIGISPDSLSSTQKQQVIRSRRNLTKKLTKQEKFEVLQHFRTVFKDPTTRSIVASNAVNTHLLVSLAPLYHLPSEGNFEAVLWDGLAVFATVATGSAVELSSQVFSFLLEANSTRVLAFVPPGTLQSQETEDAFHNS